MQKMESRLILKSTITISDSQFSTVSRYPLNPITSTLISKRKSDAVNLFFIEDYSDASLLGNAAGNTRVNENVKFLEWSFEQS